MNLCNGLAISNGQLDMSFGGYDDPSGQRRNDQVFQCVHCGDSVCMWS
jgi:hypothetical protein